MNERELVLVRGTNRRVTLFEKYEINIRATNT